MPLPRFSKLDSERKDEILRIAAEEFGELGYEKASLNRIIARAGLSKGVMYYYFADKDDLYTTVLEIFSSTILDLWTGVRTKKDRPFARIASAADYWQEWITVYKRSIRHFLENPTDAAVFWQSIRIRASGTSHPTLTVVASRVRDWVQQALSRGQQIGAVRTDLPESLLLDTAFGMLEGFDRWLAQEWNESLEGRVDELARLVVDFLRRIAEPVSDKTAGRRIRRKQGGRSPSQPKQRKT